jgi:hypothetical protein
MKAHHKLLVLFIAVLTFACTAQAKSVDNATIIKLLDAGMSDDVILKVIAAGDTNFDTSKEALMQLKAKGASADVIVAIVTGPKAAPAPAPAATAPVEKKPKSDEELLTEGSEDTAFGQIFLIDGKEEVSLTYQTPQKRGGARGLGFGGYAVYAVLNGNKAARRMTNKTPSFLIAVQKNAQPQSSVTLAWLAVRKNGNREVQTTGGGNAFGGSVMSGIPADRTMAVSCEKYADQKHAIAGYVIYKVIPSVPLQAGEYAIVNMGHWFDFGID